MTETDFAGMLQRPSLTLPFNYERSDVSHEYAGHAIVRVSRYPEGALLLPEFAFADGMAYRAFTLDVSSVGIAQLNGEPPHASVHVNFSPKVSAIIKVLATDLVEQIDEERWLYQCVIRGPSAQTLHTAAVTSFQRDGNCFYLRLFHHTNEAASLGIHDSGEIWSSAFNYSGTGKFPEARYAYFTSLEEIRETADLMRIGILPPGAAQMGMVADQWRAPRPLSTSKVTRENVAPLDLKTATVNDMQFRIERWIRADCIAPMHWILHRGDLQPQGVQDWMEAVLPLVFRVPSKGGIEFDASSLRVEPHHIQGLWSPSSFIAGYGWTENGLLAAWVERDNADVVTFAFEKHPEAEALSLWRDVPRYPMVGFPKSARRQFEEHLHRIFEHAQARKIGRNDLCYCGSAVKYKRCHGAV